MAHLTTDEARARRYLERALAVGTKPDLSTEAIDDLMVDAQAKGDDGTVILSEGLPVFTSASLGAAASQGWIWKAGLASDAYDDIGGGNGKYLRRPDWMKRCRSIAAQYASGAIDVFGGVKTFGGVGSFAVTSSTAAASDARYDDLEGVTL